MPERKKNAKKPVESTVSRSILRMEEDRHTIAQANIELDDKGRIAGVVTLARRATRAGESR